MKKKKILQNTQSTTSLAEKIPKNSQPYRNPMLWARKNLTILLHNNIQGKKKMYKTPNQQHLSPKKFQKIPNPTAIQCSGQGKISQYYYTITFIIFLSQIA